VRYSDSNGAAGSWTVPVKVNDDVGTKSQFFSTIAVDQNTGFVSVGYYDARNSAGNNTVQVFGSVSTDRGATFLPNQLIGPGFSNSAGANNFGNDFADYNGIALVGGSFFPVWSDNSNSTGNNPNGAGAQLDVYTARTVVMSAGG